MAGSTAAARLLRPEAPRTQVLGIQIESTAFEAGTSVSPAPEPTETPRLVEEPLGSPSPTPSPGLPAAPQAMPPATRVLPEPSPPLRMITETNDNHMVLDVDAAGAAPLAISAVSMVRDDPDRVAVMAYGSVEGGVLEISIRMDNGGTEVLLFPTGLRMVVTVLRDGVVWQTVDTGDAAVTELPPGGWIDKTASVGPITGPAKLAFTVAVDTWRT